MAEDQDAETLRPSKEDPSTDLPTITVPAPTDQRLTLELLRAEVPKIHAAQAAANELMTVRRLSATRKRKLQAEIRAGEEAKEKIFVAAFPLVRNVARREWRRRRQWGSTIPLEDLIQDAIVGFFKGLANFKVEAARTSPTNYLGQWMLVEMRRSAESMDHDLQVGHDAAERFRRIRALRSRLEGDLGREPTDEEIVAASRDPRYVTRPGMVGRAPEGDAKPAVGKGVTKSQIEEERAAQGRLGRVSRFGDSSEREDGPGTISTVDAERTIAHSTGPAADASPEETVIENEATAYIAGLVQRTIDLMGLPAAQHEIISRRYGLPPFEGECSAREISRVMGIHRERVSRVLSAFSAEMTRPGGCFHRVVGSLDREDLMELGLGWVYVVLGEWDPDDAVSDLPSELTDDVPGPAARAAYTWYQCDKDGTRFRKATGGNAAAVSSAPCPVCLGRAFSVAPTAV